MKPINICGYCAIPKHQHTKKEREECSAKLKLLHQDDVRVPAPKPTLYPTHIMDRASKKPRRV